MPGGLIQLVAYGSQDLFLTGIPQITFFKIVYKKYSNFAMESIEIPINGDVNFDKQFVTIIPKIGDLVHKIYLKIVLPQVQIYNPNKYIDTQQITILQNQNTTNQTLLTKYKEFIQLNYVILYNLSIAIQTQGSNWYTINDLINNNKTNYINSINSIGIILDNVFTRYSQEFPQSSINNYIGSTANNNLFMTELTNFINSMKIYYTKSENDLYITINNVNQSIKNLNTFYEYFCWVKKIGFYIINKCAVIIGGQEVSTFDSDFLNIYYSLNNNFKFDEQLNNMIGDTPELTTYTNTIIPSKTLYIPLPFWFCQHNGSTLPLISLLYHDLEIQLNFNSIDKCCYYTGEINLNNLISISSCSLYVDYIYLDVDERAKFANFSHEYLIQSVQKLSSNLINVPNYSYNINLVHPIKELYWTIKENSNIDQYKLYDKYYSVLVYKILNISITELSDLPSGTNSNVNLTNLMTIELNISGDFLLNVKNNIILQYTKYYDGIYQILYINNNNIIIQVSNNNIKNDYSDNIYGILYTTPNSLTFNPINTSCLYFNGMTRTNNTDSVYYNYVVPWQYYKKTPNDGINTYSFSLHPNDYQPSGSCNFSLIKNTTLNFNLTDIYNNYINDNNLYYSLLFYGINYNVLRIHNGIGTLVFSY